MNPNPPSREQIEARITALLLGELPAAEAELLRWTIAQDAGLQKLHDELKSTIVLVRAAVKQAAATAEKVALLQLSHERRQELLAHFKTPRPQPSIWFRPIAKVPGLMAALALLALVALLAAMLLPSLASAKKKAQSLSAANHARMRILEGRMRAEDDEAGPAPGVPALAATPLPNAAPPNVIGAPEPVLTPPPMQIVLPQAESAPEVAAQTGASAESGNSGVYSQHIVGYVNLPLPSAPPAALPPGGVVQSAGETESGELVLAKPETVQRNAGFQQRLESVEKPLAAPNHGIAFPDSIQDRDAVHQQNAGVVNSFGFGGFGASGRGAIAGAAGGTIMSPAAPSVANGDVAKLGVEPPPAALNSPDSTTMAWNDSGVNRSRAENQPGVAGDGFALLGPVTVSEEQRLPGISDAASEDAAHDRELIETERKREQAKSTSVRRYDGFFAAQPDESAAADKLTVPQSGTAPQDQGIGSERLRDRAGADFSDQAFVSDGSASDLGFYRNSTQPSAGNKVPVVGDLQVLGTGGLAPSLKLPPPRVAMPPPVALAGADSYAGGTTVAAGNYDLGVAKDQAGDTFQFASTNAGAMDSVVNEEVLRQANATSIQDKGSPKKTLPLPVPQPEILTRENNFSTFSLNVSDVSFELAKASLEKGLMPDAASIRSEEFINAFDYRDPEAAPGQPLAFASECARDPFAHNRDFLRFSIKTAAAGRPAGRALNLVLLLDTSGSMERADRVAIIREALRVLAAQLQPADTVSVVTFARTARLWADGVPGDKAGETLSQVGGITPEGGTNLEEAMRLAYETARRHYLANGMNRVVLLTDGAANLGNVDPNVLKQKVEAQRRQGIALDCFGIGWEDFNDDLLEQLSGNGDGRYAFINSPEDAANDFAAKLAGALQVAAQDVKVQVEFNPQRVISWRQIGYAKHQLTKEQFRDNSVIAAEIAAQEAGNALYTVETKPDGLGPIATVFVRYRVPGTQDVRERSWAVDYDGTAPALENSSPAMRLAATAAAFSEWLAASPFAQEVSPDELLKILSGVPQIYGADQRPARLEAMIREAKSIAGK